MDAHKLANKSHEHMGWWSTRDNGRPLRPGLRKTKVYRNRAAKREAKRLALKDAQV